MVRFLEGKIPYQGDILYHLQRAAYVAKRDRSAGASFDLFLLCCLGTAPVMRSRQGIRWLPGTCQLPCAPNSCSDPFKTSIFATSQPRVAYYSNLYQNTRADELYSPPPSPPSNLGSSSTYLPSNLTACGPRIIYPASANSPTTKMASLNQFQEQLIAMKDSNTTY